MSVKRKFFPFDCAFRERGDSTLIFVGFIAAASLVGVTSMMKRAGDDGKNAKIAERKASASQNPISAAIVAKSLFAAPGAWTTPNLVSNAALLPNIYVDPYIASQNTFAAALPALRLMNPSPVGNTIWDSSQFANARRIYVNTADRNRLTAGAFEGMMSDAADGGAFQTNTFNGIGTTKTTISNFVTSHCTAPPNYLPSASFTGYYCVQADFSTENYSQIDGKTQSGTNKSTVFFGAIQAPPLPTCDSLTLSSTVVQPGDTVSGNFRMSGVLKGYTMTATSSASGQVLSSAGLPENTYMPTNNSVRSSGGSIPISINLTNLASYNYTTMPENTSVNVGVTLKGITGNTVCAQSMTVKRPSCSLTFNKANYGPGEQVTMTYRLSDSKPGDVAVYQQSNITMNGSKPASPDGAWTYTGKAPTASPVRSTDFYSGNAPTPAPPQNINFSASVTLKRGGMFLNQCSANAVSTTPSTEPTPAPCSPNPRFTSGVHYGPNPDTRWNRSKYQSIPGTLPFELYNVIAGNPSSSSLVSNDQNRLTLCKRVFGAYAWPWGFGELKYSSPGNNTVCSGFDGAGCMNAQAAGNPMHMTWTLCRCDIRTPE